MDVNNIGIEQEGDIIFTTVGKYKLFLQRGAKGQDAFLLYSHLMFTARLQKTNSVKANNKYLMTGLHMGKSRLQDAKKLLLDLQLIKYKQEHKPDGTFGDNYIEVATTTTPVASKPADGEPAGGCQPANALTKNINASTKKRNASFTPPTEQEVQAYVIAKQLLVIPKSFILYYTESGWKDKAGKPITNWKLTAVSWHNREVKLAKSLPPAKSYQQQLEELYPRSK